MILRLAAVANTEASHPIVRLLRQLFQVALAGTQADDRRRREVLEEALEEDDPLIRRVGVEALGAMIQTYISRSDDFEQIGAEPYCPEWAPADSGTIHAYYNWALDRLRELWRKDPELRSAIEDHVASELRNLLMPELLPTIEAFVREVVAASGRYFGAVKSIGDWLYFDSPEKPTNFSGAVRILYDVALPVDPVDQALLYSRFWASDIHDPDTRDAQDRGNYDFEYSARRAAALAARIAQNPDQTARVIRAMAGQEVNSPQSFAQALAEHLPDPLGAFEQAVEALDASGSHAGVTFVGTLLSALDRRLAERVDDLGALEAIARKSVILTAHPMYIVTSLRVTDDRLDEFTNAVREGKITPRQTVSISHGRRLDQVSPAALKRLISAVVDRGADGGAWAALEILSMVTHATHALTPEIIELAKLAILSSSISGNAESNVTNSDYNFDRMVRLLDASGAIDGDFARAFAFQVEQACRTTGGRHVRPSDTLRAALAIVVRRAPNEVWTVLAGFYEIGTLDERERLNSITSATKPFAFDVSRTGPGALFDTPLELMLDWVAGDPDGRIGFLLSFFPILEQKNETWAWHPALQQLAKLYGYSRRFRDTLRLRIYPRSWGGSLKSHLTSFEAPLAAWVDDRVLGDWASNMLYSVNQSLKDDYYSF